MTQTTFSPFGTLASKRHDSDRVDSQRRYERTLEAIATVAGDFHLEPSTVWLAHDIARFQHEVDALDDDERLATTLFVLLVLHARNQGSTRVRLEWGDKSFARETLDKFAEALTDEDGNSLAPEFEVDAICTAMEDLLERGGLSHIMGDPEQFRPLIREDDTVCTEQTFHLEETLRASLQARLKNAEDNTKSNSSDELRRAVSNVIEGSPYGPPTEESERKLRTALLETAAQSPLTVVSGGPGTGKTSIIVAIIRTLCRLDLKPTDIALAAPTGKASKRMRQSMIAQFELLAKGEHELDGADADLKVALDGDLEPVTLHRLLEFSPYRETFRRDADNPLDHRAVIVDEASMIDLELMTQLTAAVDDKARLILVGDKDQLPSVGAGAVFGDLSAVDGLHAHRLVKNHRTEGEAIIRAAGAINRGDNPTLTAYNALDDLTDQCWTDRPDRDFFESDNDGDDDSADGDDSAEGCKQPEGIWIHEPSDNAPFSDFVDRWHARFVDPRPLFGDREALDSADYPYRQRQLQSPFVERRPEDGGGFTDRARRLLDLLFAFYEHSRLLCLTRVRKRGADRANRMMHRRFQRLHGITRSARFHAGEPVMVQTNDYELDVFNGDQGLVLYTRFDERDDHAKKRVVFPTPDGDYRAIRLPRIRDRIKLSYAMTVHKSQGSEFDHIAIALPEEDIPLATRELLYTAITRAKHSVTLHGGSERLEGAIQNPTRRLTGITDRLDAPTR